MNVYSTHWKKYALQSTYASIVQKVALSKNSHANANTKQASFILQPEPGPELESHEPMSCKGGKPLLSLVAVLPVSMILFFSLHVYNNNHVKFLP